MADYKVVNQKQLISIKVERYVKIFETSHTNHLICSCNKEVKNGKK